ncbi:hypothetical protein HanPI659440_Chr13g0482991 [Helianthus annuus]|nr:hypothetical protein HanPI659440_Chr13g0482991 [Helianthus annuus]
MEYHNGALDTYGEVALDFSRFAKCFSQAKLLTHESITQLYATTFYVGDENYDKVEKQLNGLRTSEIAHTTVPYMPYYFNAIKFLCESLCVLINPHYKGLVRGGEDIPPHIYLSNIEYAFQRFIVVYDGGW